MRNFVASEFNKWEGNSYTLFESSAAVVLTRYLAEVLLLTRQTPWLDNNFIGATEKQKKA